MVRLLAVAVLLTPMAAAFADLPPPAGERRVNPVVRFEGIEKYPGYVFFLRYLGSNGPPVFSGGVPPMVIEIIDSKSIDLYAHRHISVFEFFALTREDFEKRVKDDPSRKWLTATAPGALRANIGGPITTASIRDKVDPVTTYRVSIRNGQLNAVMVNSVMRSEAPVNAPSSLCGFASAFTLCLTSLGIYLARRAVGRPKQGSQRINKG